MFKRLRMFALCLVVLATGFLPIQATSFAQESTPAATVPEGDQLFTAEGVSSPILATAPIADPAVAGGTLVLARIELQPGSDLPAQMATGPEILYVESGDLTIQDDFGFGTSITAGSDLVLNPGTGYTLANAGSAPVQALRLSAMSAPEGGTPSAAPVDLTGATTLLSIPIDALPEAGGTIYMAQVTFQPGAASGQLAHGGSLGVYIVDGVLKMTSPSGLEGDMEAGQTVVLPATAALQARTESGATSLIVGIGSSPTNLMAQVTLEPTPEPTPEPTAEPTAEPEPTTVPTPTPDPETLNLEQTLYGYVDAWEACNAQGMLFYVTDFIIWETDRDDGEHVSVRRFEGYNEVAELLIDNCNISVPSKVDIEVTHVDISHSGIEGAISFQWLFESGWLDETSKFSCNVSSGTTQWRLEQQVDGRWLITDRSHSQQLLRQSCRTITPDSFNNQGSHSHNEQTSTSGSPTQPIGDPYSGDLSALLPSQADVPSHLVITGGERRTLDQVAANYAHPADTVSLFQQWGWQGNVTRAFNMPSGVSQPPGQVEGIYVSIHAFSNPENARAALDWSLQEQMLGTSLYEISVAPMGDYARALYGPVSYGTEITFLVQKDNLLLRLSASSRDGDPSHTGTLAMNAVLSKLG